MSQGTKAVERTDSFVDETIKDHAEIEGSGRKAGLFIPNCKNVKGTVQYYSFLPLAQHCLASYASCIA